MQQTHCEQTAAWASSGDGAVTAAENVIGMVIEPGSTGVCIVRVERQSCGLRFSVLATSNARVQRAQVCLESTQLVEVVDAVEGFLIEFARGVVQLSGGHQPPS